MLSLNTSFIVINHKKSSKLKILLTKNVEFTPVNPCRAMAILVHQPHHKDMGCIFMLNIIYSFINRIYYFDIKNPIVVNNVNLEC